MEAEKSTEADHTMVNVSTSGQHSPDLRIVLIGGRELTGDPSNKSEAGNIILGKKVFDTSRRTAQSSVSQQEVHGRQVTVVDTPGWWWHYPRENTPKLDQMEIQNSVHLCPPGPHAFLLVIPIYLIFPEIFKKSLEEHLSLINKGVFDHTIVLFTTERHSYPILQNVITTWPALQEILEACGNRRHVLVINNRQDTSQVRILLKKIDAMVAENAGRHFCINLAEGNALRVKMETIVEGASRRFHKVERRREKLRALIEDGNPPPTHLRIAMVGAQWSAKSSAGNTILGKQAFPVCHRRTTEYCEMSHSMVADRKLTLVDSPGWYYNSTLQDLRQMDRLEIENSVHLCSPGPHAVLLVVSLASAINTSYWKAMLEHMGLFTDDVWNYTIVLFTRGDWLGVKTVEERIESESGLRWLMEKCGNRYHVLNNKISRDKTQVTELLEKIEEMWAGNKSPYYEVNLVRAEELEAKKEAGLKMAKRRKQISQRQERILRHLFAGDNTPIRDMKLVLVGKKESGKSMAGNRILADELFDSAWGKKEFQNQQVYTMCVKHERQTLGMNVSVVETPGWLPDMTTTDWLKKEILHGVSLCAPGPHIFLLAVPMSKTFTEDDYKSMVQMLEPLGEKVWRHCMVLFTWGDWLNDSSIEEHIAAEGKALMQLVEKCGNRYYAVSASRFGDDFPVMELFRKMFDLMKRNNGQCFTAEGKPGQGKKPLSWQEEWSRREQELIDRMMKALAQEPEEPPVKPQRKVASIDGAFIPSLKTESLSDFGSTFWIGRIRARVSEWLNLRVGNSVSSGVESMSACTSHMDDLNEYLLADYPVSSKKDEVALGRLLHGRVSMDTADDRRRYSL